MRPVFARFAELAVTTEQQSCNILVGRDLQIGIVNAVADQVEAGRAPAHTALTGLRGMGKTILLRSVMHGLHGRGWLPTPAR
jgi:Cdc6-like AAA superfamily ATPase